MNRPSTARTVRVIDIVGGAEVRRLAGRAVNANGRPITRHTLLRWRAKEQFPPPIRKLDQGEIFDRSEVRVWLERRTQQ